MEQGRVKKINHEFLIECVVKPWKFYLKTGVLTFGVHPKYILYRCLTDEIKLINLTNDEKHQIWRKAKEESKQTIDKETYNTTEVAKINFLVEQINLIGYDKAMDTIIRNTAYDIAITDAFAKFKNDNFDVEQYVLNWIAKDEQDSIDR